MKNLTVKIQEAYDAFVKDASFKPRKATSLPVHVPARHHWQSRG